MLVARPVDLQFFEEQWLIAAQKEARVYAVDPVTQDKRVIVDLSDRISGRGNEEGFWRLNPRSRPPGLLVYGSRQKPRRTVLSWLTMITLAKFSSRMYHFRAASICRNHNGGDILRLPDGTYLLGFGDGGRAGDPRRHGQNPRTWLGSLIRIRLDLPNGGYAVPVDNPSIEQDFAAPETRFGLRNPGGVVIFGPDGRVDCRCWPK